MERASLMLRFRNLPEQKGEYTMQLVTNLLAPLMEMRPEEVKQNIDAAQRINTTYTRNNKLPREIHIKFMTIVFFNQLHIQ